MSSNKEIFVYAHWADLKDPTLIGILVSAMTRGKEIFSFEYTKEWLQNGSAHFLDPDLQLFPGRHYTKDEKLNFGSLVIGVKIKPICSNFLILSQFSIILQSMFSQNPSLIKESNVLIYILYLLKKQTKLIVCFKRPAERI